MTRSSCIRSLAVGMALIVVALGVVPAVHAQEESTSAQAVQRELGALDLEQIYRLALAGDGPQPVYRNLGGGLHSLEVPLSPELRERLLASAEAEVGEKAISTFILLATGQQLTSPSNASTLIHAALSSRGLRYNHWWTAVNLGGANLVRNCTIKVARPGKTVFNRTFSCSYNANSIVTTWYKHTSGVGATAVHTQTATVKDATSSPAITRSYAVP